MKIIKIFFYPQLILLILLAPSISTSQIIPFQVDLALEPDEPNAAYHIETIDDEILISGQYFSQSVGYWLPFVAKFDQNGAFISKTEFQNDTSYFHNRFEYVDIYNDNYTFIGTNAECYLFTYNSLSDSIEISNRFDFFLNDFLPESFLISEDRDAIYYCGFSIEASECALLQMKGDSLTKYLYGKENRDSKIVNMRFNSNGDLIAAAESGSGSRDSTYIIALDENFKEILNGSELGLEASFTLQKGMVIDHEDSVVCTGGYFKRTDDDIIGVLGAIKFDKDGNNLWIASLGNTNQYYSQYPRWNSVTLSSEEDGYILAGSAPVQSGNEDTLYRVSTIGKLSLDGDSIWYYQYSFRSSPTDLIEEFRDITTADDGGYIAVGISDLFNGEDDPWARSILLKVNTEGTLDVEPSSIARLEENYIDAYPNPTSSPYVYISCNSNTKLNVEIRTSTGQLVDNFTLLPNNHTIVLDISNYAPGLYYFTGVDYAGKIYNSTIIKQ